MFKYVHNLLSKKILKIIPVNFFILFKVLKPKRKQYQMVRNTIWAQKFNLNQIPYLHHYNPWLKYLGPTIRRSKMLFLKILALCTVSFQERFLINSRLWCLVCIQYVLIRNCNVILFSWSAGQRFICSEVTSYKIHTLMGQGFGLNSIFR